MTEAELTEDRRKEIFLALVNAQDQEMKVADSRKHVSQQFSITETQVKAIEKEGMDKQWPPLD